MAELLFCLFFCSAVLVSADPYGYQIDDLMDEALAEYATKVADAGDTSVDLEGTIGLGGFVMGGPRLKNMSSLRRVGSAWLLPSHEEEATVVANLTLDKMHLDGEEISGPRTSIGKPRINVRSNLISISFLASMQTVGSWIDYNGRTVVRRSCTADYNASVDKLSSVVLVTKDEVIPLDNWVRGMLPQISNLLNPIIKAVFEKHFDLCQSLRAHNYKLWNTGGTF